MTALALWRGLVLVLAGFGIFPSGPAQAHALDPGYLQIDALGQDQFAVLWREPSVQGRPMGLDAVLPEGCAPDRGLERRAEAQGWSVRWVATCSDGLAGGTLRIDGLDRSRTDVLMRVQMRPDGPVLTHRATPNATSYLIPRDPSALGVLASYGALGMEHILSGWDHLLFVLGLMLLVRGWRRLVAVITAFTVAHSLSLVATALGWLVLPGPPVEAVIALSIAFLAAEAIRHDRGAPESLTMRAPWIVAFGFGLLHGMGFGSALIEIGLPTGDLALALLSFNLGVEAGQLVFVAGVLALRAGLRRLSGDAVPAEATSSRLRPILAYGIGTVAMFWTFERIAAFHA